jgi:glycosyltransferase involved in cell wall biosynthesis
MVIPTIDAIGGAERQVILLATELAARGYSATIVALSGTGTAEREALSKAGVAYLSLGMRKAWIDPRGWLRYLLWVRHHRPDIVHAHIPHATWFARWVRLIAPVRAQVDTLHTSNTGGKARRIGYRLSGFLSDGMTCVSAAVADAAAGMGVALREDLKIVPNGVPIADLGPDQDLGDGPALPSRPFRWIAVGRLAPVKDYATLLRAFAILPAEPQLQIVGSGPEEGSLRSLVAQLGIEGRVDFAGFQREIDPLLRAADAFVLASLWEGLPVGVLEAGAAGLPVVATDAAGTREALLPGETGFLVPVGNPAALSEAMATVMAMPDDRRRTMGNRGRQFVQERFSLSVVVDQWERLYADLLQAQPESARFGWRMPHRRPSLWNRILSKRRA